MLKVDDAPLTCGRSLLAYLSTTEEKFWTALSGPKYYFIIFIFIFYFAKVRKSCMLNTLWRLSIGTCCQANAKQAILHLISK